MQGTLVLMISERSLMYTNHMSGYSETIGDLQKITYKREEEE